MKRYQRTDGDCFVLFSYDEIELFDHENIKITKGKYDSYIVEDTNGTRFSIVNDCVFAIRNDMLFFSCSKSIFHKLKHINNWIEI